METIRRCGPEEGPCGQNLGGLPRVPARHPASSGEQYGFLGTMTPATANLEMEFDATDRRCPSIAAGAE